ncbi:hypothetical protein NBRC116583_15420 [Arenicella sp. 4NH20-0111]|uniref:nucleotidyltransferase family protein n=1 Tax=Arenicella sp. 4NH20-0111 TaxID=3127648 RepID=UPI0031054463
MIPEKRVEFQVLLGAVSIVTNKSPSKVHNERWIVQLARCDFPRLLDLAVAHGLVAWLDEALRLSMICHNNNYLVELSGFMRDTLRVTQFQSIQQSKIAIKISNLFTSAGIDHVVFKGLGALNQFYSGFVQSRVSDDLDLLVRPESLPGAVSELLKHGYKLSDGENALTIANFVRWYSSLYRWRDLGFINTNSLNHKVDLHWRISDRFTYPVDVNHLIESRTVEETAYGSLPCVNFSEHFVYVCVHGYSDFFFRLRHLVDVYAATKQPLFDIEKVMLISKQNGVEKVVQDSIQLAGAFFDGQPLEEIGCTSEYVSRVSEHFALSNGWPKRTHPNTGVWRGRDRYQHLQKQIKHRSRNCFWFSPLISRALMGPQDIACWSGTGWGVFSVFLKSYFRRLTMGLGFKKKTR